MANKKKKKNPNHQNPQAGKAKPVKEPATPKGYTEPKGKPTISKKAKAQASAPRRRGLSPAMQIGLFVALIIAAVGVFSWLTAEDQSGVVDTAAWDLPALENSPSGDDRVKLADFTGKPLVVNFFASWCDSCDRELPTFTAAADTYQDQVTFVYINSSETGNWKPMADRHDLRDSIIGRDIKSRNGSGLARSLGGTGSMPITAFYDANGNLVDTNLGEMNSSQLNDRLVQLGVDLNAVSSSDQ